MVENDAFINAPASMIVPASKHLLAILNSSLADYYIRQLGVTRNGGYFEYKPMFVEQFPVLKLSEKEQDMLAEFVDAKDEKAIDDFLFRLYGLTDSEIRVVQVELTR